MRNIARSMLMLWMIQSFFGSLAGAGDVASGCAELYDPRETGLPAPPPGVAQVTCAAFFPYAVHIDDSETSRVEVRIDGQGITAVALGNTIPVVGVRVDGVALPQTGGFIELFDDGTHGDRVAGDGIWTREGVSVNAVPVPPIREMVFNQVRYTDASGTHTINIWNSAGGQYGPARLGGLDPAITTTLKDHGNGFFLTPNVVFMVDQEAFAELRWLVRARPPTANILLVGQRFFAHMPDVFDKLLLMPGAPVPGGVRGNHLGGQNQVEGIGRPVFDNSAQWGSDGRLDSVFVLNWTDSGPVLHELTHRWGVQLSRDLGFQQCAPAHWGMVGAGRGVLGGFDPTDLVDNGNGTWSFPNGQGSSGGAPADTTPLSQLELYVAGFLPPEEVPPIAMPVNVDCNSITQTQATITFAADAMTTVTIDDIIAVHGPRLPVAAESPREFSMAWLVVLNRVPTLTEAAFMQYRSEYIARREPGDMPFRLTFWEATGGRATLQTLLPMFADGIFSDRFETR